MADLMEKFYSFPPVSRTIISGIVLETLLVHGRIISGYRVLFHLPSIFKIPIPEIWRIFTPFGLVPADLNGLWTLYMFYTYIIPLETNSPRFTRPGDFATYVAFVALIVEILAGAVLGSYIFTHALLLAFVYTYASDNRGRKVHFIFFQIPAELLPWAMLGMALLMGGTSVAMFEGTGIVAAHLYDFLTRLYPTFQGGRNFLQTPAFVRNYFSSATTTTTHRAYGTSFQPAAASRPQPAASAGSRGWTSGLASNSWSGRGSGHRLGGD